MGSRPLVLLDCDEVLADFVGSVLSAAAEETGFEYRREEFHTWDIFDQIGGGPEVVSAIRRRVSEPGFCSQILPLPGAVEGFELLTEMADVYVVTTAWNSPTWMAERERWLARHFRLHRDHVIFATHKYLVHGDFFVDDKPDNVRLWDAHRDGVALLWDAGHNRLDGDDLIRVVSWEELHERVLRGGRLMEEILEERCRESAESLLRGGYAKK